MEKRHFILISPHVRRNAIQALLAAPDMYSVALSPPARSHDQNAMFHAICSDIAKSGFQWAGKKRPLEAWKVLLVSAHTVATNDEKHKAEIVPGIENEFVNIRESTARMSVGRTTSLIEYALAWCVSNRIPLNETRLNGFIQEHAA